MEAFAPFLVIMLVGLAVPITLLFTALAFDLVVLLYAMFRFWHDRTWPRLRQIALVHGIARRAVGARRVIGPAVHYQA